MSNDRVLEKVRKLLALANDERGNDTERETALRQAHALLIKHGLDMLDVDKHQRETMDPRVKSVTEGWGMPWTRRVRGAVGRLFMCKYFFSDKVNATRSKHIWVGRESNTVTAEYMSTYVIDNILKEGRRLYTHNLSPQTRAFAVGCAERLSERVDEMLKQHVEEHRGTGKDVAIISMIEAEKAANEEFVAGWQTYSAKKTNVSVDRSAYNKGRTHADSIGLNVQVARPDNLRIGRE